jgi:histone H3/H4
MALLTGCGEPMFENAGSQNSLLEDREACAMEIDQSIQALAYRQNPTAHPEYVSQVFEDMNQCIEHKGWKQVRSQQEQEQLREAVISELAQTGQPAPRLDTKATDALVRGVEERLARVPSSAH